MVPLIQLFTIHLHNLLPHSKNTAVVVHLADVSAQRNKVQQTFTLRQVYMNYVHTIGNEMCLLLSTQHDYTSFLRHGHGYS